MIDKKEVWKLFLPLWIEAVSKNLISFFNLFILNKYSPEAAAGISVCSQIIYLVSIFYSIVTLGTIIMLSQSLGANEEQKSISIIYNAYILNLFSGLIFSLLLLFFSEFILNSMGISDSILVYSSKYLKITGAYSFITALFTTSTAILNCYKLTSLTMIASFSKNILNVILVFFSVKLFQNNVIIAIAYSSIISQFIGLILILFFIKLKLKIDFNLQFFKQFEKKIFEQMYKLGVPSALEVLVGHLSSIVIISIISSMGNKQLITRTYVYNLMMFIIPFGMCLGQTTQIMVGRYFGGGNYDKAYKISLHNMKIVIFLACLASIILYIFADFFLTLYTKDIEIINLAKPLLFIVIILETGRSINYVCINSLKAVGVVKFPVIIGIITMWGGGVLFSQILGINLQFGLKGVWIAYCIDEWTRSIFMLIKWNRKNWMKKEIVDKSKVIE